MTSPTKPPETYTARDVARMLGVTKSYVCDQIRGSQLRAQMLPKSPGMRQRKYRIQRDELVRWMVGSGIPAARIRSALNPGGELILVGSTADVTTALVRWTATVDAPTLFHLGRALGQRAAWGIVVDTTNLGMVETCRALLGYSREADRPELIGLHGDDFNPANRTAADLFDAMFPRAWATDRLAKCIMQIRPQSGHRFAGQG